MISNSVSPDDPRPDNSIPRILGQGGCQVFPRHGVHCQTSSKRLRRIRQICILLSLGIQSASKIRILVLTLKPINLPKSLVSEKFVHPQRICDWGHGETYYTAESELGVSLISEHSIFRGVSDTDDGVVLVVTQQLHESQVNSLLSTVQCPHRLCVCFFPNAVTGNPY